MWVEELWSWQNGYVDLFGRFEFYVASSVKEKIYIQTSEGENEEGNKCVEDVINFWLLVCMVCVFFP